MAKVPQMAESISESTLKTRHKKVADATRLSLSEGQDRRVLQHAAGRLHHSCLRMRRMRRRSGKLSVTLLPPDTVQRRLLCPSPWGQFPTWHSRSLNTLCSIPLPFGVPSCEATKGVRLVCDDLTDAEDDDVFAPSTPVCLCHLVAASCMTVPAPRCRLTLARVAYSTTNSLGALARASPFARGVWISSWMRSVHPFPLLMPLASSLESRLTLPCCRSAFDTVSTKAAVDF